MYIDFPRVTDVIVEGMEQIRLPQMVRIRQKYDTQKIEDISGHLRKKMQEGLKEQVLQNQYRGKRICITAGSRGIPHLAMLIKTICDQLKEWGADPFVIPAMGSHGGGTAQGQLEILASYGVTEEALGVPILSSMEVVQYGELSNGTPLYCDKYAFESDGIVLLNKEKPHTDFRGPNESGLAKMIAIGLGKHKGASAFHMQGFPQFPVRVPEAAEIFLAQGKVAFGVGVVQNAYDEICIIEVAPSDAIMELDRKNLVIAKEKMARFKFDDLDVLVLDEIGKNISGYGHDPNVTGRANGADDSFKHILKLKKMVILGVSKESHDNGTGIAEADVSTLRCMRGIDWSAVWTNLITSTEIQGCKMPMYANSDREAILLAIRCCNDVDFNRIKLARIHNTQELFEIEVSEALYEEIKDCPGIEKISDPEPMQFDREGYFLNQD